MMCTSAVSFAFTWLKDSASVLESVVSPFMVTVFSMYEPFKNTLAKPVCSGKRKSKAVLFSLYA